MPVETSKFIHEVSVETTGKAALEQLLAAIKKVETAVVTMGEKFDQAAQTIATPIKELGAGFDKLSMSLERMQRGLGDRTGFDTQRQAAQLLKSDILEADRAIEQFRIKGTRGFRGPSGQFQSRQQMMEQYFGGAMGPNVWSGIAERGPHVGTPAMPHQELQFETAEKAAKRLGITIEELGARTQETTAAFAAQDGMIRGVAAILETAEAKALRMASAEEQLAASTKRATEATRELTRADRERWVAMGRMWPGSGAGGQYVSRTAQATAMQDVLRQQMGVRPELEWTRPVGGEKGVPYEPLKRAEYFGEMEAELEQIQKLEVAIGRKTVVQQLMARGSRDVAERFEKQFAVTRSKEEILREVSKTGTMTAEMEKELGLQTERAGKRAGRAGNMFRYFGRYLLRYLILWQGIQAVRGISKAWFAAHMEMADAVADFGWRVNATAEDVARYREKLRDVSMMAGVGVGEIASPLAGRATEAELLRATEASKVFGGSVEDWLRTLEKGDVTLDAYAHGLRISTLATEDFSKLVSKSDDISKEFNITQAEAIGLLSSLPGVLQTDAEGAAELTEALAGLYEQNQLLMTLGVAPAMMVGPGGAPQRRPMPEVMAGISRLPIERQRQLAIAIGLTTEAQQQLFLDAVAGWGEVDRAIRETAGATGDFEEAMAGADESMKAHVESMKAAWTGLLGTIGDTEAAKSAVDGLASYFKGLTIAIEEPLRVLEFLLQVLEAATPGEMLAMLAMGPALGPKLVAGLGMVGEAKARAGMGGAAPGGAPRPGAGEPPPPPGGIGYFPPMPTLRMGEGMTMGRLAAEMERVIDEVFTRPYTTASGEVIQVTKEQINALRENTVVLDENGEAIGLLNAYAPALAVAQENLKSEMEQQRFNLERLQDITPQQFDTAMRTILPTWEARLAAIPGFEEEKELQTFFVGEQDVLRQQLATQTAMSYTLQDILDVEKDQLEGQWNIPSGVTMRVPLQSLDLMRWMQQGGGGGVATDMMPAAGPLEAAATAQDNAAVAMQASANAQTAAAQVMTAQKQVSMEEYMTWAEAERLEYAAREPSAETKQTIHRGRPVAGGGGKLVPTAPVGTTGVGALAPLSAQIAINLVSKLFLDKKIVAETVQTELARQLVNTTRAQAGGGASLRP